LWLNDCKSVGRDKWELACYRNTLVQLLTLYTDPESHNAQRYRQADRQTDDMMMPIADHTV